MVNPPIEGVSPPVRPAPTRARRVDSGRPRDVDGGLPGPHRCPFSMPPSTRINLASPGCRMLRRGVCVNPMPLRREGNPPIEGFGLFLNTTATPEKQVDLDLRLRVTPRHR